MSAAQKLTMSAAQILKYEYNTNTKQWVYHKY